MAESELAKLERQYQQARARLEAARAREREHQRKLDARRKIILGGALIERAGRDPETAKILAALVRGLSRQHDRKAFEDWALPRPGLEPRDEGDRDTDGTRPDQQGRRTDEAAQ
ncbi:mobilization protein [Paracoccus kondratievae]|uniref:mobilization protein n=1 Tax=Paracoccus kondratievae TaxID=135740 RepID=UPI00187924CE|nr:mobilization protein [Paracoccus kondratievae]